LKKVYEYICMVEEFITKVSLLVIALLIFTAAIARCLRHPIIWAVDISTFLFAWVVFFSADIAMRNGKLVNLDMVMKLLPEKFQKGLKIVNYLIIILFLLALIGYGFWLSYTTRYRTFPGLITLSYTWATLSVPVGSILMLVTSILKIKDQFNQRAEVGLEKVTM